MGLRFGGVVVVVEMVGAAGAGDVGLVGRLADLVNRVYAVAEDGLWADGWTRTSAPDMAELVAAGEIAVARRSDRDGGDVVGIVRVHPLDHEVGEFGMLAADPAHRGLGIGRDLVAFAEDRCRHHGRTLMQLDLLVPRGRVHPGKAFARRLVHPPRLPAGARRRRGRDPPPARTPAGDPVRRGDLPQAPHASRRLTRG